MTEEWDNKSIDYNESLRLKKDKLASYKALLSDAKPLQEQKPLLLDRKLLLEQELKVQIEMNEKEMKDLKNSHSFELMVTIIQLV